MNVYVRQFATIAELQSFLQTVITQANIANVKAIYFDTANAQHTVVYSA